MLCQAFNCDGTTSGWPLASRFWSPSLHYLDTDLESARCGVTRFGFPGARAARAITRGHATGADNILNSNSGLHLSWWIAFGGRRTGACAYAFSDCFNYRRERRERNTCKTHHKLERGCTKNAIMSPTRPRWVMALSHATPLDVNANWWELDRTLFQCRWTRAPRGKS
jgi:hypothetical protein